MKNRRVQFKIGRNTMEFDMGELRSSGHIPAHYDRDLLAKDEKLLAKLMSKKLGKVISREKRKRTETVED